MEESQCLVTEGHHFKNRDESDLNARFNVVRLSKF